MQFIGLFPCISFSSLFSFNSLSDLYFALLCCEGSLALLGLLEFLFIYLVSKECQCLSSVAALEATWGDEGSSLHGVITESHWVYLLFSPPLSYVFQNSSSVCQLLLPRLKRETIWHLLYLPNRITDISQSPLNSVPTNITGLQGTWQGLHTQQQEMHMAPPHTQPHFSPPLPRMGGLCRPCCLLKLWVNILW